MQNKIETLKIKENVEVELELYLLLEKTIELENQLDRLVRNN